ncbi:MAG: class I SAM-dependent rRNA methyltransferase [Rhodothalassiaceae bacterium]
MSYPVVRVKRGMAGRLARGHPWAFSNEIDMTAAAKALEPGSLIRLTSHEGRPFGPAFFHPHSLIAARRIGAPGDSIDEAFFTATLTRALRLRQRLIEAPFYRLVHAEADGLPGLIVDRYGEALVVQANSAGADRHLAAITAALQTSLAPKTLILRLDTAAREQEGLPREVRVVGAAPAGPVQVTENEVIGLADLMGGQKTGWFFDHRPNRAVAARLARGASVLDLCSYTGAFALHAANAGAKSVLALDRDAAALALAQDAAARNHVAIETRQGDLFDTAEALAAEGARFDMVLADPPAFVKSRKALKSGLKGYEKLTRLAARLTAPDGVLMIASCSQPVDMATLQEQVANGLARAGRTGRILIAGGAGPDHPTHPMLPESAYLKAIFLALD